mgnify:FL=1
MVAGKEAPQRGDVVWVSLNPQAGHEQAGRRPALVLSPFEYNERVGLALMCPVTSKVKGYPFEVTLTEDLEIGGVVLADQVKSLDWRVRRSERACSVPQSVMIEVFGKLNALLT